MKGKKFELKFNEDWLQKGTVLKSELTLVVVGAPKLKRTFLQSLAHYLTLGYAYRKKITYTVKQMI